MVNFLKRLWMMLRAPKYAFVMYKERKRCRTVLAHYHKNMTIMTDAIRNRGGHKITNSQQLKAAFKDLVKGNRAQKKKYFDAVYKKLLKKGKPWVYVCQQMIQVQFTLKGTKLFGEVEPLDTVYRRLDAVLTGSKNPN